MLFLHSSVRQTEYLIRIYGVKVPFIVMNSFNTDDGTTTNIIKKYECLFLSNVDNLGAVVDFSVLGHAENVTELMDKTKTDVKGGTIIDYEGTVHLLQIAQVPKEHLQDLKCIRKFRECVPR
ncbi:UTP--glucose-1-phosphate uridylyltransferase-domain-containing protein [Sphaerosporella brunnea]|uniref:UTP--glucose-1-phosphate uridylyltransferase n=1 Tax=Sphaerosporella brunnea TaxID=1250544 RepID=A0A5J5ES04_9PEZI|nr:UTP--glucose-1-phosphate uridylyltransferase-domain-containing protein [Sphaerosporella brunnea]KAA8902043.1 UTP--glucose-1-phosphate uridylyltransferase-domain-containing protein [Sphaerosporella brunnea]